MFERVTDYDFRIYSEDKESYITFTLEQYLHNRMPSLSCAIEVVDNNFRGWNINVWFALDELLSFIKQLDGLSKSRNGGTNLTAMTQEDFNLNIKNRSNRGGMVITYSLMTRRYNASTPLTNTLSGGFEIDPEFFQGLVDDFRKLTSVANLNSDIDFTC